MDFHLHDDQKAAVAAFHDWIKNSSDPYFVLEGPAGTGKTYTAQAIIDEFKGRVVLTAPTNKATKVLRDMLTRPDFKPECCTIYSLLGLTLQANGEVKELTGPRDDSKLDLSNYDLVVVDEGSMVNEQLVKYIDLVVNNYDVKFLFLGDPAQLPPVKEKQSKIWTFTTKAVLTKVKRHDNQILKLVTAIREKVDYPFPRFLCVSDNHESEGVWKVNAQAFLSSIYADADERAFLKPNHTKVIAWRNVTVDRYNKLIRNRMFGQAAMQNIWLVGERVIFTEPAKDLEGQIEATTDDEGEVQRVTIDDHPLHADYKVFTITIALDTGKLVTARVLHPSCIHEYTEHVAELADAARANSRFWRQFWEFKELFHSLRYAYAITSHRAQGSTYDVAYVDSADILVNQNKQEAFRCLYVACSRPKRQLIIT